MRSSFTQLQNNKMTTWFPCHACRTLFKNLLQFEAHCCTFHHEIKQPIFICGECTGRSDGIAFESKEDLDIHVSNKHISDKVFEKYGAVEYEKEYDRIPSPYVKGICGTFSDK